jgi:two-component system response regulator AtoC
VVDPTTLPINSSRGGPLELVVCEGTSIRRVPLDDKVVTIGRGTECTVRLTSPGVSRLHARMWRGPPVMIQDMANVNRTVVNGTRLTREEMVEIDDDAVVIVGEVQILLRHAHAREADPERSMACVWKLVELVAPTDLSILVLGETGVGKEVVARKIHELSPRASQPLLAVNCAALNESTVESELFGHERGAFTGATAAKLGLLEAGNGSTILLDEIGDLPLGVQAKLLRALDAKEVVPLGAVKPRPIDVRLVAATHRSLAAMVDEKTFREDLYFRLDGLTIHVPPLRDRREEIPELARLFVREDIEIGADAYAALEEYGWPGNVRELKKVMERATVLAGPGPLRPAHLQFRPAPPKGASTGDSPPLQDLRVEREKGERRAIERALEETGGNQTRAAALLGISRRTLVERLGRYGIKR